MPVQLYAERDGNRTLIGSFPDRQAAADRVGEMEDNASTAEDKPEWPDNLDETCWPEGSDAVIEEDGNWYAWYNHVDADGNAVWENCDAKD